MQTAHRTVGHYENFPVASLFLPARLRPAVRAIYAFARSADDFADEGDHPATWRLERLAEYRAHLRALERGEDVVHPVFRALAPHIRAHQLPHALFHDLLSAFEQDCGKTRYADFGEVMGYCRRSANPIGRLLLHLYGDADPRHLAWSDGICSALQLINFLQDIPVDWRKGRVYLPQDELARFGIAESQIAAGRTDGLWQMFMKHQVERARRMLQAGAPLGKVLPGRIGMEMRLIILGGSRILEKIHDSRGDVFTQRPVLTPRDWPSLTWKALFPGGRRGHGGGCSGSGCGTGCGQ
ncbi:MAG TPA: squalene synthase HpnC [Thiobacillaceae bacterium]|nr:squalene synthase HpnC [Thiobacillaceae bacterium]HNU63154.1 squalene synthase HpnC [Thiobacillaceae bacterium]